MLIVWNPGHELLTKGLIYADYPYPAWTVVVMLPFAMCPPQTAMVLWFICNLIMLAASVTLLLALFDWAVSPALLGLVITLSVFFLPVLTSMWLGQLTIFSLFILILTTYMFLHKQWTWLGVMLGLSFIKPQVMILLAGLILLWALWQRRWQTLLAFGAIIAFLILISLPAISSPRQIIGGGISNHLAVYIQQTSTLWGLFLSFGFSWLVPLVISLTLLAWIGWIWLPLVRGMEISSNRIIFLFSAATMVNLMTIPYSWMHNLTLLLLPFGFCLAQTLKIKSGMRFFWLTLLFVIMHPLVLGLFVALIKINDPQAYQVIPALALFPMMIFLESQTKMQSSLNAQSDLPR